MKKIKLLIIAIFTFSIFTVNISAKNFSMESFPLLNEGFTELFTSNSEKIKIYDRYGNEVTKSFIDRNNAHFKQNNFKAVLEDFSNIGGVLESGKERFEEKTIQSRGAIRNSTFVSKDYTTLLYNLSSNSYTSEVGYNVVIPCAYDMGTGKIYGSASSVTIRTWGYAPGDYITITNINFSASKKDAYTWLYSNISFTSKGTMTFNYVPSTVKYRSVSVSNQQFSPSNY